jgi:hypothetical protein
MSIIDKIIGAITPPESEEERREATARARMHVGKAPWLALVLDHHRQIDAAFLAVKATRTTEDRQRALRQLAELLAAHAIAEETVIYPALSDNGETGHATMAYTEQSAAKMQLGLLERMDLMSEDFDDKFAHLEGAVKHHVYEEEGKWFIELTEMASAADHQHIADRYRQEFDRYFNGGEKGDGRPAADGVTGIYV